MGNEFIKRQIVLLAVVGIALSAAATGQQAEIVRAEPLLSKNAVYAGETFKAALRLRIAPGWHINANELADEFLFPSSLELEETKTIKIVEYAYPKPHLGRYEYSEAELAVFEGEVYIGVLIEAAAGLKPGAYKLKGVFTYQACDARSCLPPKKLDVEIKLEVVPASHPTEGINQEIFSKISFNKEGKIPDFPPLKNEYSGGFRLSVFGSLNLVERGLKSAPTSAAAVLAERRPKSAPTAYDSQLTL